MLDLEISNSSLLAINKTLEREMRKQSAELRRYRRLSRSGRLSIAPAGSMRTVSAMSTLTTLNEDAEGESIHDTSDLADNFDDSASEEDDEEDLESTLSTSSNPASQLSPGSRARRQRVRDEKRLLLDLSQHQQLLVDSQKMNQSIRRCLGWAEDMILEGSKALEYRVGIGDVRLGGRVLRQDEEEDSLDASAVPFGKEGKNAQVDEQHDIGRSRSSLEIKSQMEDAILWAAPGARQTLDGATNELQGSPLFESERWVVREVARNTQRL